MTTRRSALFLSISLALATTAAQAGFAGEVVVDSTSDTVAGDGVTTLREAIEQANATPNLNITFDPTVFATPQTIALTGELLITETVTISGPGADLLSIDGAGNGRVFRLDDGDTMVDKLVTMEDLTIRGGVTSGADGAGILAVETLLLRDSTVTENTAGGASGPGVRNGGGIEASAGLTLERVTISNNRGGRGAGIRSLGGSISIADSLITGNGGSISTSAFQGIGLYVRLYAGDTLLLAGSQLSGNTGTVSSGGCNGVGMNLDVEPGATATITHSRIEDNLCTVSTGSGNGGAIRAAVEGALDIMESTLSGNTLSVSGGGSVVGGGIAAYVDYAGRLTVSDSTISRNTVTGPGFGINAGGIRVSTYTDPSGSMGTPQFTLNQSTISGNAANHSGGGLSLLSEYAADLQILNSTITANTADADSNSVGSAGGIYLSGSTTIQLDHTIVAGNINQAAADTQDFDAGGGTVNARFSLIGDNDGSGLTEAPIGAPDSNGNLIGDPTGNGIIDPMLAALADYGGATHTHFPRPGSPALDAGDPTFAGPPFNDQRGGGFARILDADGNGSFVIDMGSVEFSTVIHIDGFEEL